MVNFNGIQKNNDEALFNSENRAFKYGDGLFETLKVENLKINFLEDHYFRLMASMRMLRMEIPMNFTLDFFEDEILNTIKFNQLKSARVRISIYRKDGGLYKPLTNSIDYLIEASPLNYICKDVYEIDLYKDYFVFSGLLSTIKTTNRITNVLASIFAAENKLNNCILLNENKNVVEAINGNLFMVKGNSIKTPKLSEGCIKGIVRKKLIEIISKSSQFQIEEGVISPFELQKADEIFITNSIIGIQGVTKFKKSTFKTIVSNKLKEDLIKLI